MDGAGIKPEQPEPMPGVVTSSAASTDPKANTQDERPRYKSYRKKYRKMKLNFDKLMEEANELFVSERKATEIARRIKEQNDKLLDVLLEINSSKYLPRSKAYDISYSKAVPSSLPPLPQDVHSERTPERCMKDLERLAVHTSADTSDLSTLTAEYQGLANGFPAHMAMDYEDAYLAAMDEQASVEDDNNIDSKAVDVKPFKTVVTERDFAVQNPVSVHNWLRKHQPHVFDGKDKESDRGGKSPPPSRRKKGGARQEPTDTVDEEGDGDSVVVGSAKTKRKRDDETYRPKGGHARPTKRKRERDEVDSKGGKKSRKSNGAEDES